MSGIASRFSEILGQDAVLTADSLRDRKSGLWAAEDHVRAAFLVRPADTAGVSAALALCDELNQTVVVHGGLTGVVQGAVTTEQDMVVSLERMNQIEEIDPIGRTMTVQAGITLQKVQEAAEDHDLMFPLDLGARGTATLGGNAATNAGGNRVLRYGVTRDLILGLEAVLSDGTIISSMNSMLKNNAGYDLKQLFIGTEGTLGIVTRLVLRLVQRPTSQDTAFVALRSFSQVTAFLNYMDGALGGCLSAFEVLWEDFYQFLLSGTPPLAPGHPYYVLIESLGGDQKTDSQRFQAALETALKQEILIDAVVAQSQRERDAMWAIRDDVEKLLQVKPLFLFDISLPLKATGDYVAEVREELTKRWPDLQLYIFGHLGDGNIHLAISAGSEDGNARSEVEKLVYQPLGEIGGSISAEHGIGLEKLPYLSLCRTQAEITLMHTLKHALDPKNLLNPGKVLPSGVGPR